MTRWRDAAWTRPRWLWRSWLPCTRPDGVTRPWSASHGWIAARPTAATWASALLPLLFDGFRRALRRPVLDDGVLGVGRHLFPRIGPTCGRGPRPRTVQHADYRLDNLLFGTGAGTPPVTVVDWQTVTLGPGPADVSYFLGAGPSVDDRRAHEEELVREYHERSGGRGGRAATRSTHA